ncbi:MAG TPA: glycosyltransferase family 4 protein [Acidimicrobiales bacterium]
MSVQRVVLVSPYALSVYGGVQEQVLAMSRVLSSRGRDVLIVAPDASDVSVYDTPAKVLRLGPRWSFPANGSKAPLTLSFVAARRARAAIDAFNPDVVHFHEPFAPLLGWSTLWGHDYPSLGTFHRSGTGPALRYTKVLLKQLATRLDVAVSVSEAAASTIRDACGVTSDVLFNGFEMERFVVAPRERSDRAVLFFIGRLEERKGVNVAINAVRQHNARGERPWQLVIAGDGPQRGALEALAGGAKEIVFLARVSDDVKRAWLRRVDVLVTPATRGESFGLVILEGFASETLVVASDIDGYRDAAGGHATLFIPGDASSLREAILAALGGENSTKIDAARHYAERWSMTSLMDAYDERYEQAIQRFRASR